MGDEKVLKVLNFDEKSADLELALIVPRKLAYLHLHWSTLGIGIGIGVVGGHPSLLKLFARLRQVRSG
jgi:hypothetical protein